MWTPNSLGISAGMLTSLERLEKSTEGLRSGGGPNENERVHIGIDILKVIFSDIYFKTLYIVFVILEIGVRNM